MMNRPVKLDPSVQLQLPDTGLHKAIKKKIKNFISSLVELSKTFLDSTFFFNGKPIRKNLCKDFTQF